MHVSCDCFFSHDEMNGQNYEQFNRTKIVSIKQNASQNIKWHKTIQKQSIAYGAKKKRTHEPHVLCQALFTGHDFGETLCIWLCFANSCRWWKKKVPIRAFRTTSFCLSSWKIVGICVVFGFNYAVNWIQCYHSYDFNEYPCPWASSIGSPKHTHTHTLAHTSFLVSFAHYLLSAHKQCFRTTQAQMQKKKNK